MHPYWCPPYLELWQGEEQLHDGVEVAGVAEVDQACVAGTVAGDETPPRFLDNPPLPHLHIDVDLQLCHGGISLHHVDREGGHNTLS